MAKEELETNPFDSLHKTLVFSPRDWAFTSEDVWIYGIIVGWGDDCCKDFEKTFSWWTKKDTKRLKYMHSQFVKIARENGSRFCTFDELEHLADLEKENAELKEKENTVHTLDVLHKEAVRKYGEVNDKLTKAKEIIRALLKHTYGQNLNTQNDFDLYLGRIKEAEQFIKDLEK